jgi:tetratricopeptide (TPR) repeat protein
MQSLKDGLSPADSERVHVGYGKVKSIYPYTQRDAYTRKTAQRKIPAAVLKNDQLEAVFLPTLGGRLWSLTDRQTGRNALYTNDVIRYSNLAVRNAWFSGGVKWNIGVIGHSPYTTDPMFTASLALADGTPVLRMYNYERIRGLVYQMDFWLREKDSFLNCRMRVENTEDCEVPMYWWSNMAAPEYHGGRIEVPAKGAFTVLNGAVTKIDLTPENRTDIFEYEKIPESVDYFFDIPGEEVPYIADLDASGRGILQFSTSRLKARKLFSWGKTPGGNHWQAYLTNKAGRYVEIQAGVNQTQYGCIPMPARAVWEWMEFYGPYDEEKCGASVKSFVKDLTERNDPEEILTDTEEMAVSRGTSISYANEYGAFAEFLCRYAGKKGLPAQLDFGAVNRLKGWTDFMNTGVLFQPDPKAQPDEFFCEPAILEKLKLQESTGLNSSNWYAAYQTGIALFREEKYEEAERRFLKSIELTENAWAYHALACARLLRDRKESAAEAMRAGIRLCPDNLSYVKEGFRIFCLAGAYGSFFSVCGYLPEKILTDSRVCFYRVLALHENGQDAEAYTLLTEGEGLVPDDIREGENALGSLYLLLCRAAGAEEKLPYRFDFKAN